MSKLLYPDTPGVLAPLPRWCMALAYRILTSLRSTRFQCPDCGSTVRLHVQDGHVMPELKLVKRLS